MTTTMPTSGTDADFSLKGRIALITGATRGIGAAIARRFISSGARVAVTYLATGPGERDAGALRHELGEKNLLTLTADATSSEAMQEATAQVAKEFGDSPDILVVNAAHIDMRKWDEITIDQWDHMMEVNLRGAFVAALHAVPSMRRMGYGKVIVIGSVMAHIGDPRALHYVTSKGAIVALTRCLARELGPHNINVNAIAPGLTMSEGVLANPSMVGAPAEATKSSRAFKRTQTPDDLTGTLIYLCSADSDFVTGHTVVCDGGSVMR